MIGLAIGILSFGLGAVILAAVIFVVFWGLGQMKVPVPPRVEMFVWVCFIIICLIYLLVALEGGSLPHPALFR